VALKFEPVIVTCVPTGPEVGVNDIIVGCVLGVRVMERMFPTAS